jgi:hypothetical protein
MTKLARPHVAGLAAALVAAAQLSGTVVAGPQATPAAAVQPARFAGTWVGTQRWDIEDPPPGARQDQPVMLTIQVEDGKLTGSLEPFLGGDEGATIVEASIVGEELHATAVVGRPPQPGGRRGPANWKDAVTIAFVFRASGVELTGSADVRMSGVPWMKFGYQLGRKRSRY